MKRWLAVMGLLAAVAYGGYVRDSEARLLRRGRCVNPCPPCPPVECCAAAAVPAGSWTAVAAPSFATPAPTPPIQTTPTPQPQPPNRQVPSPGPGPETPPRPVAKVHLLLLVDDANKDAGAANTAGADLLERLLREGLPKDRFGSVVRLAGNAVTPDGVRTRLGQLNVGPDDTLVGYYSGAMTFNEMTKAYTLTPVAGVPIPRQQLHNDLANRRARLTVLLTDAPARRVMPEGLPPLPAPTGPFAFEALFLRQRGLVDWHAAAPNQTAFPRDNEGGLFTLALVQELARRKDGATWAALFNDVRATTDRLYKEYRKLVLSSDKVPDPDKRFYREQPAQTPAALAPADRVRPEPGGGAEAAGRRAPLAVPTSASGVTAELVVHLPAGARLYVEGRPTQQAGATRHFVTPPLRPGKDYFYTLRAELPFEGQTVSATRTVQIRAGDVVELTLDQP